MRQLLVLAVGLVCCQGVFVDRGAALADRAIRCTAGTAVVDTDGDGQFELFVSGCHRSPNQLLQYGSKNKKFEDLAKGTVLADPKGPAVGVAGCDVDGDGREELYVVASDVAAGRKGSDAQDRMFKRGHQGWKDLMDFKAFPANSALRSFQAGRAVGCVFSAHQRRNAFLVPGSVVPAKDPFAWLLEPEEKQKSDTAFKLFTVHPNSNKVQNLAVQEGFTTKVNVRGMVITPPLVQADPDDPQHGIDVLVMAPKAPNILFRATEARTHISTQVLAVSDEFENSRAVAVADFDADGNMDVVACSWDGTTRLWHQIKSGEFVDAAEGTPMAATRFANNVVIADFDNDGHLEVLITSTDALGQGAPNQLFKVFLEHTLEGPELVVQEMSAGDAADPSGQPTGVAVADFDADGILDLFIGQGEVSTALPRFMQLDSASPKYNWLRVLPLDPNGGPARGADVILSQSGRRQRRVVDAGSGYRSQHEPVAHFGLGEDDTSPVLVTVRWPQGTEATVEVEINQLVRVEFNDSGGVVAPKDEIVATKQVPTENKEESITELFRKMAEPTPRQHVPQRQPPKPVPHIPQRQPAREAKKVGGSSLLLSKMHGKKPTQEAAEIPNKGVKKGGSNMLLRMMGGKKATKPVDKEEPKAQAPEEPKKGGSNVLLSKMLHKKPATEQTQPVVEDAKKKGGSNMLLNKMMGRKPVGGVGGKAANAKGKPSLPLGLRMMSKQPKPEPNLDS